MIKQYAVSVNIIALRQGRQRKKRAVFDSLRFLEAPPRFELGNEAFAELCLTTWL